ncbi:MAG: hypothetical protein ABSB40_06100 [Nitrososphaeria archaeon]|jgi:hypothetical protein
MSLVKEKDEDATNEVLPNVGEKVFHEKAVNRKVQGGSLKFCSQACAEAYKEINKTHKEVIEEEETISTVTIPFGGTMR